VNEPCVDGPTPLFIAIKQRHLDIVQLLLEHGAAVDQAWGKGFQPLHAAVEGGNVEVKRKSERRKKQRKESVETLNGDLQ
jgi:ankyrin repeat protein